MMFQLAAMVHDSKRAPISVLTSDQARSARPERTGRNWGMLLSEQAMVKPLPVSTNTGSAGGTQ